MILLCGWTWTCWKVCSTTHMVCILYRLVFCIFNYFDFNFSVIKSVLLHSLSGMDISCLMLNRCPRVRLVHISQPPLSTAEGRVVMASIYSPPSLV